MIKHDYKTLKSMGYGIDKHKEEEPEVYTILGSIYVIIFLFLVIPMIISLIALIIWFNNFTLFIFATFAVLTLISYLLMRKIFVYVYTEWLKENGIERIEK